MLGDEINQWLYTCFLTFGRSFTITGPQSKFVRDETQLIFRHQALLLVRV
uniref:Uncharacterized protein n=1 Tax=Rhizophora mucronata TaxID=61149 RepID=A0A2P2Q475_RHIMU